MKWFKRMSFGLLLFATAVVSGARRKGIDSCFKNLPSGWGIVKSFRVSADQLPAIEGKLGARIESLSNTVLSVHGRRIQVNLIDCPSKEDAKKIYSSVSALKGDGAFCLRRKKRVIEFVGGNMQLAKKAGYELGFVPKPATVRYRIRADIAPIVRCDYMSFNELYQLCLKVRNNPDHKKARARVRKLLEKFRFGKQISLRTTPREEIKPSYRFTPRVAQKETDPRGESVRYVFEDKSEWLGIPYVTLVARIKTRSDGVTPTKREGSDRLTAATEYWPADDPDIIKLARHITKGHKGCIAKVDAILTWLTPGKNIRFGGPVTGSRWGVKKVLKQGYGQCWDFADCFATLCRASGIPSRQVGGWLYGADGHIWAEVLIEDEGWVQVDPTGGGGRCGIYHIPYFVTEAGDMPVLYVSRPKVEMLAAAEEK